MKKICSSCGAEFEGVICNNCGISASERTTIITVSKPVYDDDEPVYQPAEPSKHTLKALKKQQSKAERANRQVKKIEEKEERRSTGSIKRERRLAKSEESSKKSSKILAQFHHVLSLSITGATRQAIHFVISPRGSLAFILLMPLCLLIPIIMSVACTVYVGVETSPDFFAALGQIFSAAMPAILKGVLFWFELCAAMILYLRAHSFAIGSAMTVRRAVGLVCVAQLPALFFSPLFAVCLFIYPVLSLLLAILAVFQFVIMVFVGVEFAAMDKKKGVFTSFSVMLAIFICTAAALCAVNFPTASDYIVNLVSKIYL